MNAAQMCKHSSLPADVAFCKLDPKVNFFMKLLGKMLKKKVLYGNEMQKNSPTVKEFIVSNEQDLEKNKAVLIAVFNRFSSEGKTAIKIMNHPFFGKMTYEDWDALMWKHVDHHLQQFGV